jgi:hypothetical protein
MTPAVLDRPGSRFGFAAAPAEEAARPAGERGGGTLEDLLNETLRETRTSGTADCPVCHARMTLTRACALPRASGGAGTHAECDGCGSRLR